MSQLLKYNKRSLFLDKSRQKQFKVVVNVSVLNKNSESQMFRNNVMASHVAMQINCNISCSLIFL